MSEQWKDVVGYEGYYAVSDCGNIHSYHIGRKMKVQRRDNKDGEMQIGLRKNGKQVFLLVHRLVAQAFIKSDLSTDDFVHHRNGDTSYNLVKNLKVFSAIKRKPLEERKACVRKRRDRYYGYYYDSNGKQVHVGAYNSESEAIEAVVSAKTLAQEEGINNA